jgi:signal transduction histidine kinase
LAKPVTAWVMLGLALGLFVAFGVLFYSPVTPPVFLSNNGNGLTGFWAFPLASILVIGVLIALRRPANPIGWICLVTGVAIGASLLGGLVGSLLTHAHVSAGVYLLPFSAIFTTSTSPALGALIVILLIFPDGSLPSPRWRWLMSALLVVMAAGLVLTLVDPAPGYLDLYGSDVSPLAIPGAEGVVNALVTPENLLFDAIGLATVVSLFLRLRGADADRRHQVKWIAYAGALSLGIYGLTSLAPSTPSAVALQVALIIGVVIAGLAVPIAIGVAVLKYRLYDIDLVISRTLVYGSLAVLITAVYVGIAVGIGSLVGSGGKPNLGLSILATAIVAVGFQPVRERLQRVANRLVYGKRATPYEVLSQFSERVAESYAVDAVLPRMARVLAEGTGAQRADVWLRSGERLRVAAAWPLDVAQRESIRLNGNTLSAPSGSDRMVEVRHQGELLGALSVSKRSGETLTPVEENLLAHLAGQAGLVLKNVGLTADLQARLLELRASRQRLVGAQDEARRRLERNLHDGAQQHLVALKVKLGLVEMLLSRDPAKAATTLTQLKADADDALETVRDLARGIYPSLLAERGLATALESQARKVTVPVAVDADGIGRYSPEIEAAVYFSVLEAMQNVQKYAAASRIAIHLREKPGELLFSVDDDGRGFDAASTAKGSGLTNMADRLDALGGAVQVTSVVGTGTSVRGRITLTPSHVMAAAGAA